MNIETLQDYINVFQKEVIDSGFRRDVNDAVNTLPNVDGNSVAIRELAKTIYNQLESIHGGELPEALQKLLPKPDQKPFTANRYDSALKLLLDNKTMEQEGFHAELEANLNALQRDLERNTEDVTTVAAFLNPYVAEKKVELTATHSAIFSLIFKDAKTTGELSSFSKTILQWNRVLPLYHQLIKHTSPETIKLVEVQNGSIDIVVNLDVDVAVNLAELFKVGFYAYAAYLMQKRLVLPMLKGYVSNERIKALDEQKEQALLENIRESVALAAEEQHTKSKPDGSGPENPTKIIEQTASLVTSHIIKGNDAKLLALPTPDAATAATASKDTPATDLRKAASEVRTALQGLPASATSLLIAQYAEPDLDEEAPKVEGAPEPQKKVSKK